MKVKQVLAAAVCLITASLSFALGDAKIIDGAGVRDKDVIHYAQNFKKIQKGIQELGLDKGYTRFKTSLVSTPEAEKFLSLMGISGPERVLKINSIDRQLVFMFYNTSGVKGYDTGAKIIKENYPSVVPGYKTNFYNPEDLIVVRRNLSAFNDSLGTDVKQYVDGKLYLDTNVTFGLDFDISDKSRRNKEKNIWTSGLAEAERAEAALFVKAADSGMIYKTLPDQDGSRYYLTDIRKRSDDMPHNGWVFEYISPAGEIATNRTKFEFSVKGFKSISYDYMEPKRNTTSAPAVKTVEKDAGVKDWEVWESLKNSEKEIVFTTENCGTVHLWISSNQEGSKAILSNGIYRCEGIWYYAEEIE